MGLIGAIFLHPLAFLAWARPYMAEGPWRIVVEDATLDMGDGWMAPGSWRWNVEAFALVSREPHRPSILFQDAVLSPPRVSWGANGLVLTFTTATLRSLDLHFDEIVRQKAPPPVGTRRLTIVVESIAVEHFGMTMRKGINPEVIVEAENVSLLGDFRVRPFQRQLDGLLALESAWAEVAGIRFDDVHARRVAFVGLGFEVDASGKVGTADFDATMEVLPLIGPPKISMTAHLHETTLDNLADAILGAGDLQFVGRIEVDATLVAGGDLGAGGMAGTAEINVQNAGFSKPNSHRAIVMMAVRLAPFLTFDAEGNVIVGDIHGGVSFDAKGVSLDSLTYDAKHSVGELRGYVRSDGISAKLHFRPRPNSGAIEWGFILRGAVQKPKVALALPAVLRDWKPCTDPNDCAISGGPTTAEAEPEAADEAAVRELEQEAAKAATAAKRDDRRSARETRREDAQDAREAARAP